MAPNGCEPSRKLAPPKKNPQKPRFPVASGWVSEFSKLNSPMVLIASSFPGPHPGARSNFSLMPALGGWLVTITHGYLNGRRERIEKDPSIGTSKTTA
jgi:hypothetical protein